MPSPGPARARPSGGPGTCTNAVRARTRAGHGVRAADDRPGGRGTAAGRGDLARPGGPPQRRGQYTSVRFAETLILAEIGVRIKGNEVRKIGLTWNSSRYLEPLVGACAGVMDVKTASAGALISSVVIGNVPRVGTIFIAFADGTRHEQALRQGSMAQMRKVDATPVSNDCQVAAAAMPLGSSAIEPPFKTNVTSAHCFRTSHASVDHPRCSKCLG